MFRNRKTIVLLVVVVAVMSMLGLLETYEQSHRDLKKPKSSVQSAAGATASARSSPGLPGSLNPAAAVAQQERFKDAFSALIRFYGRVIDQHGNPVAKATVKMAANDKSHGGKPSEYALETDDNGLFSITDIVGLTLAIEVSKAGYQVIPPADNKVTSSGLFEYGLSSDRGKPLSSEDAPVVFVLRKPGKHEPLIKVGQENLRFVGNGSPLLISLDPEKAHQIILLCWTKDMDRPEGQRQYDWRLEVNPQNGALVARTDALNYEAPENGYMPADVIDMPASLGPEQWRGIVERSYFIRFGDGIFARATIEVHPGGDHFVVWSSFMNPRKGSRILE